VFSVIVVIYEWVLVSASSDDMVQLCCFVNFDRYGVSPVIMQRASFDTLRYALAMYVCMYVYVYICIIYVCTNVCVQRMYFCVYFYARFSLLLPVIILKLLTRAPDLSR